LRLMEITGAESDFVGLVARASRPCVSDFPAKKTAKTHARDARATTKHRADDFEKMPTAIQRRILQAQLTELGFLSDFELVEQLRRSAEKFVSVNPSLCVARGANGKLKLRNQSSAEFNSGELKLNFLDNAGRANFDGVRFNWNFEKRSPKFPPRRIGREFFDADKTGKKIILRHWRAGDRFQPIGLKSPVKLQDLFTNAKIPRAKRFHLILAETIRGEIFWVESLRISENFKLTPETKRRLVWCWRRTATAV
jgi:tRNA(Ile)-lysidine synthase